GSSNGSYVNQQRVSAPKLLKAGDAIRIGKIELIFEQVRNRDSAIDTWSMQETMISDSPVIKQITVLVADIRGFTALSEQVNIRTLTKMMNSWFHQVSDIIFQNQGVVDKFIGDCVFARWETEISRNETALQALNAALLIHKATQKINENFTDVDDISIGVGINTGAASMGIGQDNTALGDAVNTAFRLENATKVLKKDIVMSESTYKHLPEHIWKDCKQHIRVKGKRDTLRVCGLSFAQAEQLIEQLSQAS
ncbi:MAG: adenylate/guanylate cyclase domain-containing protein, partial [Thioalkalispiraceae bacterium]